MFSYKTCPKSFVSGEIVVNGRRAKTSRSSYLIVYAARAQNELRVVLGENYRSGANELRSIARGLTARPCPRTPASERASRLDVVSYLWAALGCVLFIYFFFLVLLPRIIVYYRRARVSFDNESGLLSSGPRRSGLPSPPPPPPPD